MKNKIKYFSLLLLTLGLITGCEKFLEKTPDLRTQLNSTDKVAQLLVSAYPKNDYMSFTEKASDNSEDKGPSAEYVNTSSSNVWEAAYFWEDLDNASNINGSTDRYWNSCYLAIASANAALDYINSNPNDVTLLPYKGEALIARAYAHFMLVNLFAKTYEVDGQNNSPGIPFVTKPETIVFEQYGRGTVASTYQLIEQDLTQGIPLLKNSVYKVPKYHFTTSAANAFAARFYLYKGDYEKVIAHAVKVFPSNTVFRASLRPWNTTYASIPSAAFELNFTKSSQNSSLLITEANSVWARSYFNRHGLGETVVRALIQTPNVTGGNWAYRQFNRDPFYSFRKWDELFFESQIGSGFGQPYVMIPLFTADELLLNRAEAYTLSNQFDLALQDINTFISTRVSNYNPSAHDVTLNKVATFYKITDPKEGLIKAILDMKRAEFVEEGLRWFDLNRYKIDIKHLILDENRNTSFIELKANDPRRLFQLPEPVTKAGIERNPR